MKTLLKLLSVMNLLLIPIVQAADASPVAAVRTAPVQEALLRDTVATFGEVRAEAVQGLTAKSAGQVITLSVHLGQRVDRGAPLLELATDPATLLAYQQARDQLRFAQADLAHTRELLADSLATRAQVALAEKAVTEAEAGLLTQQRLGASDSHVVVRSPVAGVVSKLDVQVGDRVAASASLLTVVESEYLVAVLGVEPADAAGLPPHAAVALTPVFGDIHPVNVQLDSVNGLVNADTGLVDARVRLKGTASFLPGTRVKGLIVRHEQRSLAVPRGAVLNDGQDYVFIVREKRAHRVKVTRGTEWQGQIGVSGALLAGDRVVIEGQAVLAEQMMVKDATP